MSDHIPTGFSPITPYFLVEDTDAFIEFVVQGLGGSKRSMNYDDDGRLVHGEFDLLGEVIELGQPAGEFSPTLMAIHLYVEDPDAAWKRAIDAGASPLYEVMDHDYGERSGGVIDPCGNRWFFAAVFDQKTRNA